MQALMYAAGVLTGVALMIANRYSVKKAVEVERNRSERLREENRRLQDNLMNITRSNDCRDAYHRGRRDGREDPLSGAEQLVRTFNGRKVEFRGGKTAC